MYLEPSTPTTSSWLPRWYFLLPIFLILILLCGGWWFTHRSNSVPRVVAPVVNPYKTTSFSLPAPYQAVENTTPFLQKHSGLTLYYNTKVIKPEEAKLKTSLAVAFLERDGFTTDGLAPGIVMAQVVDLKDPDQVARIRAAINKLRANPYRYIPSTLPIDSTTQVQVFTTPERMWGVIMTKDGPAWLVAARVSTPSEMDLITENLKKVHP